MEPLHESKSLTLREAGYDEYWLQGVICDNPGLIGLGELQLVAREKVVSSGGKLDILLQNIDEDTMYEVEVQLGETDPSHIIRTIEYWDFIRKKYPQRQHFAVLIAESITKRFFNVINLCQVRREFSAFIRRELSGFRQKNYSKPTAPTFRRPFIR